MKTILEKIKRQTFLHDKIAPDIIKEKDVKLGLRNSDGTGVVVGITTKGMVVGYKKIKKGKDKYLIKPSPGKLYYCGHEVKDIVHKLDEKKTFGFEDVIYLLLTGKFAIKSDLKIFKEELVRRRALSRMERKIIMGDVQNENQMYALHSVISHMSRCDPRSSSREIEDVINQSVNIIAKFPTIVAYNYNVMRYARGTDLNMLRPRNDYSAAENFLYMLKGKKPDLVEAQIFDRALILHAEHGGGNNSTFTVRTVSSSGANTYMAITSGIASLSGHLHGGANESVELMMKQMKKNLKNWESDKEISSYLKKIISKKGGDGRGVIYGFGHAVYTLSDPRAVILKKYARGLAEQKGQLDEFKLYERVERVASTLLSERKGKPINANVDYYSGLLYRLMGIPRELYTPIFAMARVVGWCAHRIEQIIQGKILRPAYISVNLEDNKFIDLYEKINREKTE